MHVLFYYARNLKTRPTLVLFIVISLVPSTGSGLWLILENIKCPHNSRGCQSHRLQPVQHTTCAAARKDLGWKDNGLEGPLGPTRGRAESNQKQDLLCQSRPEGGSVGKDQSVSDKSLPRLPVHGGQPFRNHHPWTPEKAQSCHPWGRKINIY